MLGRAWLKLRQRFGHGLRVAWYRDVVRPRILRTAPVFAGDASVCEIHVLTSASDWLNLIWALKSFYHASGRSYALCIHDDGSLTIEQQRILLEHFPRARLISRQRADEDVLTALADFPLCRQFRKTNHLAPKVFDFRHYLRADRMLLLDSDVLFFSEPRELVSRIEDPEYLKNTVNGDVASAYTVDPKVVREQCGVDLIPRFNSGLGLIHRESLNLEWMEEFLGLPGILGHFWRIEQTLFALCSSRFGVELLPSEYDVFLDGVVGDRPARHYVGAIRHLMYSEGIRKLAGVSRQWSETQHFQPVSNNS
jgi:hypothetical protein